MPKRPTKRRGVNFISISDAILVAERSSIRGAARTLGVPQSVVSRRLRALEQDLGVSLFVRHQAGVRLTAAGRRFLETARDLVSQLENSARNARAATRGIIGRVKVGILSSIAG